MAKPDLLKWVPGDDVTKITDPPAAKKNTGWQYKERPAFQFWNWIINRISKWLLGLQGGYADIVVGSATQVSNNEATHVITDLNDILVTAGSRVLILDGTHTLTANLALSNPDISLIAESSEAIIDVATFTITLSGLRSYSKLRVINAGVGDIVVSGVGSVFIGIDIDGSIINSNNGVLVDVTNDITGYVKGVTEYIEFDVGANSTIFDIYAALPTSVDGETLGPTGSGAVNIWSALDDVPAGAKWIEVLIYSDLTVIGIIGNVKLWSRKNGSATAFGLQTIKHVDEVSAGGATSVQSSNSSVAKLILDSNNVTVIRADWSISTVIFIMYLIGWGV